ncbi:hypothetical protein QYF61_020599 [Mycteria americana]|uniref:Uncharacterized protein n=1 Tax=Mycteria americana TaxID=33587 RepID=A0AAN7N2S3_MYCAM|nr:hypothetical protein QYF61_020597 [Mycteria americana]KAK4816714.1 hypothetical protein QYF61_020598 [Mycteria americana]KAK4816715.1 hypothetical protein QYF61_020599 [Mycteria americana]
MAWAHTSWHDPRAVADRITTLRKEQKVRPGKGKATACAVLAAALVAGQKERHQTEQANDKMAKPLQEQIRILQSQLTAARNTTQRLHAALSDALDRAKILRSELEEGKQGSPDRRDFDSVPGSEPGFTSLAQSAEKQSLGSLYATRELESSRKIFYLENEEAVMRPLMRTETTTGRGGRVSLASTRMVPYSATQMPKIQEKYTRLAQERETEYVWRISWTGGDGVLLWEDEAQGYWGPGVYLTTDDPREPWSSTQRAAYGAGSLGPLERGDPACIETPTINHLTESLQKAACLQLMHDRRLVPQQPSPMQLIVNPGRMTPLIRGLPESLKLYAVQLQDRLWDALTPQGLHPICQKGKRMI